MWEEYYSALSELPDWLRKPVPFIVNSLPLLRKRGCRMVLDVGCGAGRNSTYLGAEGFTVIGVDTSLGALRKTRDWAKRDGLPNVLVLCCSMTHLPFVRQAFHAVISVSVIHHALQRDVEMAIGEILIVLKGGGLFLANLLSTKDFRYGSGEKLEKGTFRVVEAFEERQFEEVHHFFSRQEVIKLLEDFQKISIEPVQSGAEPSHEYWKVVAIKG
jgi:SAM-dependent methyltransferase